MNHLLNIVKHAKKNLCIICEREHTKHDTLNLGSILLTKEELVKEIEGLKNEINIFKYNIRNIKIILDRMSNMLDLYYEINNNIINNYDTSKRNYNSLHNINSIKYSNKLLIKSLNEIINKNKIYEFSFDKFYSKFGDKYIGERKNNKKEGKGIMYYINGDRYEGDWKNNFTDGKGILYNKNGDRYEGDLKDILKDRNDIINYNNNNRYEGISGKILAKCQQAILQFIYLLLFNFLFIFIMYLIIRFSEN